MKSIREIADEIGVSKQAVFKKMKCEPLSTSLQGLTTTVDGRLMVKVDGESLIKKAFSANNAGESDKKVKRGVNQLTEVDGVVDAQVDGEVDGKSSENKAFSANNAGESDKKVKMGVNQLTEVDGAVDGRPDEKDRVVATLEKQLEVKDHQIHALMEELAAERQHNHELSTQMAALADQAQRLQLAAMTKELPAANDKPSLWHRIFG